MKKSLFLFFVLLITIACTTKEQKITPRLTSISNSIYVSVTIQPDSLYEVYASVQGILDDNLVQEGDTIYKDQAIIEVKNNNPKLSSENARLNYVLAKENYNGTADVLAGIEEDIKTLQLQYKNDSSNYYRQKNLWKQNIGSKAQYDSKKLAFETTGHKLKKITNTYDRKKYELKTQMQQASNAYEATLNTSKDFTITSKINGTVYELFKNPGEIITPQQPIATIGSTNTFIIEMLVDEVDIVNVKKGQQVLITLDAYKNEVFTARIDKIFPNKDVRNQTFKVRSRFENPPISLYPGLSGEGNIIVQSKDKALTIPKNYLIDGNKVLTEDGLKTISVGLQNMNLVEIISGLEEDTYILKPSDQ